jgi:hypothetical protein
MTTMSLLTTMNRLTTKNRWSSAVDNMLRQVVDDGFAPGFDVVNPGKVIWAYGNEAEPTLRALLNLKHPGHPDHPDSPHDPPRLMIVPAHLQQPMIFKAPESWKVQNRAHRLESALASDLVSMKAAGLLSRDEGCAAPCEPDAHPVPGSAA